VLYVSLELDEDMIAERIDARLSGFNMNDFDDADTARRARIRIRRKLERSGGELKIKYFSPGSLSVTGLRSYLKRLQSSGFYPDVIFIDYADNMDFGEFGGGGDSDYGPLGRLYIALRGVASDFHAPIWTASQTNRYAVDKTSIGISDLADSFRKAAVADFILAIAAGLLKNKDEDDRRKKKDNKVAPTSIRHYCTLVVAKNRNGPTGDHFPAKFDMGRVRIECRKA
jgi:replicative DNA helicase